MRTFESLEAKQMLTTIVDTIPGELGSSPRFLAQHDGLAYCKAESVNARTNILVTDGTFDGTRSFAVADNARLECRC